jgi:putative ABC transport system substrate-binding protein
MSYGAKLESMLQRAAGTVDQILRGARPGDIPVQQPTEFEFVINLKTAKVLDVMIPDKLLTIADELDRMKWLGYNGAVCCTA